MQALAFADEPDTVVIEEIDDAESLRLQEVTDVQVQTDDERWHRVAVGGLQTACGQDLFDPRYRGGSIRHVDKYEGSLCDHCYTAYELAKSLRINEEMRARLTLVRPRTITQRGVGPDKKPGSEGET